MFRPIIRTIITSQLYRNKHKCHSWIFHSRTADYTAMKCPSRLYIVWRIKYFKIETVSPTVVYNCLWGNTETLCYGSVPFNQRWLFYYFLVVTSRLFNDSVSRSDYIVYMVGWLVSNNVGNRHGTNSHGLILGIS
jgi:hypothetical protein